MQISHLEDLKLAVVGEMQRRGLGRSWTQREMIRMVRGGNTLTVHALSIRDPYGLARFAPVSTFHNRYVGFGEPPSKMLCLSILNVHFSNKLLELYSSWNAR